MPLPPDAANVVKSPALGAPAKPVPKPPPKPDPPSRPKPDPEEAKGGAEPPLEDEPRGAPKPELSGFSAEDDPKVPKPELEEVPRAPKGELLDLANADKPEEAKADGDVVRTRPESPISSFECSLCPNSGFVEANAPNGDVLEVLPKPLLVFAWTRY